MLPNFVLLDASLPDVARLAAAMLQARDAVDRHSWSHPQEPASEDWSADVLADPRANSETAQQRGGGPTHVLSARRRSSSLPAVSAIGRQLFGELIWSPVMARIMRCRLCSKT